MDEGDSRQSEIQNGEDVLRWFEELGNQASNRTEKLIGGVKLPATLRGLGNTLKLLYETATCTPSCGGGDHQAEWLVGRVVNHAMGSYRLVRAGLYDESLVLTRGIGEIANLFALFETQTEFDEWKTLGRRERMTRFGPKAVRDRIRSATGRNPFIDDDRYRKLCEVGTHPVPGVAPGHFTGSGTPILGGIVQLAGLQVALTELGFAVAMAAIPVPKLITSNSDHGVALRKEALQLLRSLGSTTIMNYEEVLQEIREGRAASRH
jgi:hypothetical protein